MRRSLAIKSAACCLPARDARPASVQNQRMRFSSRRRASLSRRCSSGCEPGGGAGKDQTAQRPALNPPRCCATSAAKYAVLILLVVAILSAVYLLPPSWGIAAVVAAALVELAE